MNRKEEDKLFEKIKAFDVLSENNYFLLADVFKRQIETLGKWGGKSAKTSWMFSPINTIIVSINDLCDTIRMVDIFFDKEDFIDVCFKNASKKVLKEVSKNKLSKYSRALWD